MYYFELLDDHYNDLGATIPDGGSKSKAIRYAKGWMEEHSIKEESNDIMVPCKCALCGGTGKMPDTYASNYMRIGLSGINRYECLDCNGTGIVWQKENKRL